MPLRTQRMTVRNTVAYVLAVGEILAGCTASSAKTPGEYLGQDRAGRHAPDHAPEAPFSLIGAVRRLRHDCAL
jgi:hypothetical protein